MRFTEAGREGSSRYNNTLRLATLRYAVLDQLRSPPVGFEVVTQRHFSFHRKRLLIQARRWTLESVGTPLYGRFCRAYDELTVLLSKLSDENILSPFENDLKVLSMRDAAYSRVAQHGNFHPENKKRAAVAP